MLIQLPQSTLKTPSAEKLQNSELRTRVGEGLSQQVWERAYHMKQPRGQTDTPENFTFSKIRMRAVRILVGSKTGSHATWNWIVFFSAIDFFQKCTKFNFFGYEKTKRKNSFS